MIVSLLVAAPMAVAATPFTIKNFSPAGAQLAADQSGNVWFAVQPGPSGPADIVRLTPNGQRTSFAIPTAPGEDSPQRTEVMTTAPDGTVWFFEGGALGTITPAGVVAFLPDQSRQLVDLRGDGVIDSDGNLWFPGGRDGGSTVGRATPEGQVALYRPKGSWQISQLALGGDGNVWFNDVSGRGTARIGQITPAGRIRSYRVRTKGFTEGVFDLTAGPDGNVWFTITAEVRDENRGYVGRITPRGRIRLFAAGTDSVANLTTGPDRLMWFTGWSKRRGFQHHLVGRMSMSGRSQKYLFSDGRRTHAGEVVTGGDRTMWVARQGMRPAVSRLTLRARSNATAHERRGTALEPRARASASPHRYDPPIRFGWDGSGKWRKAELASRKCNFRAAYRTFSRSTSLRREGFALDDLEQRAYFIRAIAVAYYANGRKATARRYVRRFVEVWEMPAGTNRKGNPQTFGEAHFGDSLDEAAFEVGTIKGGFWDPGEAGNSPGERPRYDGDGDGDHNNPGDPCNGYDD